jgi:hypothetical protein
LDFQSSAYYSDRTAPSCRNVSGTASSGIEFLSKIIHNEQYTYELTIPAYYPNRFSRLRIAYRLSIWKKRLPLTSLSIITGHYVKCLRNKCHGPVAIAKCKHLRYNNKSNDFSFPSILFINCFYSIIIHSRRRGNTWGEVVKVMWHTQTNEKKNKKK